MAGKSGADKRRFPRRPGAAGWVVNCTQPNLGEPRNLCLRLINLSSGGAALEVAEALEIGTEIRLSLSSIKNSDRFKVSAVVCWKESMEGSPRPRHLVGLRFHRVLDVQGDTFAFLVELPGPVGGASEARRQSKRYTPSGAAVEVNTPDLWSRLGLRGKTSAQIRDLCRGGVRIVSSRELTPGSQVTVVIELLNPMVRLVTTGEVRWCRPDAAAAKRRWNVGIAFVQATPADEEILRSVERYFLPS